MQICEDQSSGAAAITRPTQPSENTHHANGSTAAAVAHVHPRACPYQHASGVQVALGWHDMQRSVAELVRVMYISACSQQRGHGLATHVVHEWRPAMDVDAIHASARRQ
jgi:hypothetical protein